MAEPEPKGRTYFNTHKAVRRLFKGEEPLDVFKSVQLTSGFLVNEVDIKVGRATSNHHSDKVKKAIVGTLQAAASADLAHHLMVLPVDDKRNYQDYEENTLVDRNLVSNVFISQFWALIEYTFRNGLTEFRNGQVQSPIFNGTVKSLKGFLDLDSETARKAVADKLTINAHTPLTFVPGYAYLLRQVHFYNLLKAPTVSDYTAMVENSTNIIYLLAQRDLPFMKAGIEVLGVKTDSRILHYNWKDFMLLQPPAQPLSVKLRPELRPKIEAAYKNDSASEEFQDQFNITGCPATPELMDALIRKFVTIIHANTVSAKNARL